MNAYLWYRARGNHSETGPSEPGQMRLDFGISDRAVLNQGAEQKPRAKSRLCVVYRNQLRCSHKLAVCGNETIGI